MLHIRFVKLKIPFHQNYKILNSLSKWKTYYAPPWIFLFHFLEVFCISHFLFHVVLPTVKSIYDVRHIIANDLIQIEDNDGKIFSNIEDIINVFENFYENLENLEKDSLFSFDFVDPTIPYIIEIEWKNGSITTTNQLSLSTAFFEHVNSITLASNFMTLLYSGTNNGCTQWNAECKFFLKTGSYLFQYEPSLDYSSCPDTVFAEEDSLLYPSNHSSYSTHNDIHSIHNNNRKLKNNDSQGGQYSDKYLFEEIDRYIETGKRVSSVFVDRKQLIPLTKSDVTLSKTTTKSELVLIFISFISTSLLLYSFIQHLKFHFMLKNVDGAYCDLELTKQVHSSIGYWVITFLFFHIILFCCSISMLFYSKNITQYPSKLVLECYAIGSFGILLCFLRWLHPFKKCYMVVLFVKNAISILLSVTIGQFPIVCAMIFVCSYLFSFSEFSQGYVTLFECLLSLTFGDNISTIYEAFTNGETVFNILGFIWITIVTAIAMWLFFTTFTASVTYIYKIFVYPLVE